MMSGEASSAPLSFKVSSKLTSRKVIGASSNVPGSFNNSYQLDNDEKDYILEAEGKTLKSSGRNLNELCWKC